MRRQELSRVRWRKSSRSSGTGQCVEATAIERAVLIRDSKNPHGPHLVFTLQGWRALSKRVKSGAYDL
jgi:hypothetical protein